MFTSLFRKIKSFRFNCKIFLIIRTWPWIFLTALMEFFIFSHSKYYNNLQCHLTSSKLNVIFRVIRHWSRKLWNFLFWISSRYWICMSSIVIINIIASRTCFYKFLWIRFISWCLTESIFILINYYLTDGYFLLTLSS